ncbi:MAG: hypothetical protein KA314_09235 [Chloroflexi bacterium]|nr:hypothetical protein [Chloroflexota bacterium]MBP8056013.1 hypothetical protein [Chloroflexota bacterium]
MNDSVERFGVSRFSAYSEPGKLANCCPAWLIKHERWVEWVSHMIGLVNMNQATAGKRWGCRGRERELTREDVPPTHPVWSWLT